MDYELHGEITYIVQLFNTVNLGHVRRMQVLGGKKAFWAVKVSRDPLNDPLAHEFHGNEWRRLEGVDKTPSDDAIKLEEVYQVRLIALMKGTVPTV